MYGLCLKGRVCISKKMEEYGGMKSRRSSDETKELIKDTFLDLYEKNTIDKIHVRKLCEIAGINKSTFYLYYTDIYNLLEEIEKEKCTILINALSHTVPIIMGGKDFSTFLPDEDFIRENEKWLKILVAPYGKSNIMKRGIVFLKNSICDCIGVDSSHIDTELNYALEYMLTANVGMFEEWLRNDMDIEINELKKLMEMSMRNGPIQTINNYT